MSGKELTKNLSNNKSAEAFRTIREVAEVIDVPQHVLRFWESKFRQVDPLKRGGGRRYYRPDDVILIKKIKQLLYDDGYTIKGVQKLLNESKNKNVVVNKSPLKTVSKTDTDSSESSEDRDQLIELLKDLQELKRIILSSS
ncbi:MAG: MerR family transcriptional regulator [Alphaproteobacteria bacterium]|nr:MerR family transcriptional regulator [Alphaproteobacteria bacterium]